MDKELVNTLSQRDIEKLSKKYYIWLFFFSLFFSRLNSRSLSAAVQENCKLIGMLGGVKFSGISLLSPFSPLCADITRSSTNLILNLGL